MGDIGKTIVKSQPVFSLGYTRLEGRDDLPKITGDNNCKHGSFAIVNTSNPVLVNGDLSSVDSSSELVITYTARYNDTGVKGLGLNQGSPVKAVYKGYCGIIIDQATVNYGDKVYVGSNGTVKASSSSISASAGTLTFANINTTLSSWTAISNGDLSLKIDGVAKNLTSLDFSGATDMDGVASVINTALSSDGTCTYSSSTGLVITSDSTGSTSSVEYVGSTALSSLLGTGISVAGADAMVDTGWKVQTPNINGDKVCEIVKR